jgi:hypothetical protein
MRRTWPQYTSRADTNRLILRSSEIVIPNLSAIPAAVSVFVTSYR